jgi:DedD protein
MRDSHKLKEKYELSLDSRQIVTLTVASLVVLGGVFVLGVVVGKKLTHESLRLSAPADILTAADEKSQALERADKSQELTFQEELTRKQPASPAPAEPVKVQVKPPEPPKVAEAVAPARAPAPDTATDEPVNGAEAPKAPLANELAAKLPETPKVEPVTTRTNDAGALKDAFVKSQKSPEPTVADGSWTLQLSASQDKGEADRFASGLRDKGYAPFLVEANLPGKGLWYRVRMGRFPSKEAASHYLADFKRETSISGIVTTAN